MQLLKYIVFFFTAVAIAQSAQTIKGRFPQAAKKEVHLTGFGFNDMQFLSKSVADASGNFTLTYPREYLGAALLEVKGAKSVIVLLSEEDFSMDWNNFDDFSSLSFEGSPENDSFEKGLAIYKAAEAKRSGLAYLAPLYTAEPQKQQFFITELKTQDKLMPQYLSSIPQSSYARYYLNLRRLLSDIPQTATRYFERRPLHEEEFNAINFSDARLLRSGLYKELLESYFILLESYTTAQYKHINPSIDTILASLKDTPELKQDVAEYLFRLFEQRSLFPAAEHLALAMLTDTGCAVDTEREALFEQYRKMAKGNAAPDIELLNSGKAYKKLSDIKSKYRLVVFGAGWCPTCREEAPKLKQAYAGWKSRGLEIVYISLDTDKSSFTAFTADFPWVAATDFKSWEGAAPRSYFVSGTPTMYLLDAANKILLKPVSAEQVSAWLDVNK